ncbi:hypothetical protein FGG08_007315 [Glutinoglossum americanum]|uniref:Nephrocystin 3-like N-terminal domain-containing protein n=1 Tax=Glutinoglossum americanum TaxID=1670608 RepID=A0A9P8I1P2_9PEZI|nr:hypothetical protein FGG08_007315 [Glutinoglossum americanum]
MDPVTVVGLAASIVQLINATTKAIKYLNDVKEAPKDRARLAREATSLLALLIDLRYRVEEAESTDPWFAGVCSLGVEGGPLEQFKKAIEELAEKLKPEGGMRKFGKALLWTLDKNEIGNTLSRIERLKTLVGFALQKDHLADDHLEKIHRWLSAPDPSLNYNEARKKRQAISGAWFIGSKRFAEWKTQPDSFLWLHGIPGCGKTVLSCTIVEDILHYCNHDPTLAVAYFYFDFNDAEKQQHEKMIRSLITQLSIQSASTPRSLESLFSSKMNGMQQPVAGELLATLRQMVQEFDQTFIILDALDECKERQELLMDINEIARWKNRKLHMLATSRREKEIEEWLEPLINDREKICIQSALVNDDIRAYVHERLQTDWRLRRWQNKPEVQQEIQRTLMDKVDGM